MKTLLAEALDHYMVKRVTCHRENFWFGGERNGGCYIEEKEMMMLGLKSNRSLTKQRKGAARGRR